MARDPPPKKRYWDLSGVQFVRYVHRPMLNLSRLGPDEKRDVWDRIKMERPQLAGLLLDPILRELVRVFNAQILIEEIENERAG